MRRRVVPFGLCPGSLIWSAENWKSKKERNFSTQPFSVGCPFPRKCFNPRHCVQCVRSILNLPRGVCYGAPAFLVFFNKLYNCSLMDLYLFDSPFPRKCLNPRHCVRSAESTQRWMSWGPCISSPNQKPRLLHSISGTDYWGHGR